MESNGWMGIAGMFCSIFWDFYGDFACDCGGFVGNFVR